MDPDLRYVAGYRAELRRRRLRLRYVVDTHLHADHLSAGLVLREQEGVPYLAHRQCPACHADLRVDEGDTLWLGSVDLGFLYTPGHTTDSMTLVLADRILTGDFLFLGEGGAGRTDLPGGDAGAHWDALQKLGRFGDRTLVFPGHDYRGQRQSTLGEERRRNERLRARSREEYVAWLTGLKLGPAEWMKDVLAANRAGVRDAQAVPIPTEGATCEVGGEGPFGVRLVQPEALAAELESAAPPAVVDVRELHEFVGELGHVRGSRLVPLSQLARRLGELQELRERAVVTVCKVGGRSAKAATELAQAGFQDVRSLDGGMARWHERRLPIERDAAR